MNSKSILHVSICCENCSSAIKNLLKAKLSAYVKSADEWRPYPAITFDTLDDYEEKACQQTMLYNRVIVCEIPTALKHSKDIYTIAVLLISLTLERLYKDNPNYDSEDLMLIRFSPSTENNNYMMEWSIGQ